MNIKQRAAEVVLLLSVMAFMVCAPACGVWAAESAPAEVDESAQSDFRLVLIPYGWLTGFTGTLGARGHETHVSNSFGQLEKYLNFAAMAHMEMYYRDTVGLIAEVNYARMGEQTSRKGVSLDGQMTSTMSDVAAFYRLGTVPLNDNGGKISFDILGGVRIWTMEMGLSAEYQQLEASSRIYRSWVDPIVGARTTIHLDKHWFMDLRGGVGGFGAASTNTWDAMGVVGYNFWKNATAILGYRAVGLNYESGSGRDNFKVNAVQHGPVVGLALTF